MVFRKELPFLKIPADLFIKFNDGHLVQIFVPVDWKLIPSDEVECETGEGSYCLAEVVSVTNICTDVADPADDSGQKMVSGVSCSFKKK